MPKYLSCFHILFFYASDQKILIIDVVYGSPVSNALIVSSKGQCNEQRVYYRTTSLPQLIVSNVVNGWRLWLAKDWWPQSVAPKSDSTIIAAENGCVIFLNMHCFLSQDLIRFATDEQGQTWQWKVFALFKILLEMITLRE